MRREPLSLADTAVLKGLGILLIVGHNFQYLVSALPGVNEFDFREENARALLEGTSLVSLPRMLFAFFGHYGVQLFTFLSAYGLTLSFEKRAPAFGEFFRARLKRLYPSFIIAVVLWALWKGLPSGALGPARLIADNLGSVLLKLSLGFNLVRGEQLSLVGPWWFLPFIVQFYLVFPWLRRLSSRALGVASAVGFVASWAINETALPGGFIYATPLGHLPEFCLGIWFARRGDARIPWWLTLTALAVFLFGQVNAVVWHFTHIAALLVALGVWRVLPRAALTWFGAISMQLFLVNGFLRAPFIEWAKASELAAVGWGVVQLGVCVIFAISLRRVAGARAE